MTFLNIRRLLPPRKVWKVLTSKFQLRLHKSKAIKNQKTRSRKASKKFSWLSIQPKKFKHKKPATLGYQCHSLCHLQHRTTPLYVDKLFIQPVSVTKELEVDESSENKDKCLSSSSKKSGVSDYNQKSDYFPEEGKHVAAEAEADDMWESLVLASPQMEGINERAEEFIAKFRAEMKRQENLARRL